MTIHTHRSHGALVAVLGLALMVPTLAACDSKTPRPEATSTPQPSPEPSTPSTSAPSTPQPSPEPSTPSTPQPSPEPSTPSTPQPSPEPSPEPSAPAADAYGDAVLAANPLAYWRFEDSDPQASGLFLDSSGHYYHATVEGWFTGHVNTAPIGAAGTAQSATDTMTVGHQNGFDALGSEGLNQIFWFMLPESGGGISLGTVQGNVKVTEDGKLQVWDNYVTYTEVKDLGLNDGRWHMLSISVEDGGPGQSSTVSIDGTPQITLPSLGRDTPHFPQGEIVQAIGESLLDEHAVFDYYLTTEQVQEFYDLGMSLTS